MNSSEFKRVRVVAVVILVVALGWLLYDHRTNLNRNSRLHRTWAKEYCEYKAENALRKEIWRARHQQSNAKEIDWDCIKSEGRSEVYDEKYEDFYRPGLEFASVVDRFFFSYSEIEDLKILNRNYSEVYSALVAVQNDRPGAWSTILDLFSIVPSARLLGLSKKGRDLVKAAQNAVSVNGIVDSYNSGNGADWIPFFGTASKKKRNDVAQAKLWKLLWHRKNEALTYLESCLEKEKRKYPQYPEPKKQVHWTIFILMFGAILGLVFGKFPQ